jgi:hypothetical protein
LHVGWIGDRYEEALAVERVGHRARADKRAYFDRIGRVAHDADTAQIDERQVVTLGNLARNRNTGSTAANAG